MPPPSKDVINQACSKVVQTIDFSNEGSAFTNLNNLMVQVYNSLKDVKIKKPKSRVDKEKPALNKAGKIDEATIEELIEADYPKASNGKRQIALLEFLKDNLYGGSTRRNFKDDGKPCKPDKDQYEQCVINAIANNDAKDLPPIPDKYKDTVSFAVRDENMICNTDLYNPAAKELLALSTKRGSARKRGLTRKRKSSSGRRSSCKKRTSRRSMRRRSVRARKSNCGC